MSLQLQTFTDVTPAVFDAFAAKVKEDVGVDCPATPDLKFVTITHGPLVFQYMYNTETEVLLVQVLKKPLFIKASRVTEGIAEEVAELRSLVHNTTVAASENLIKATPDGEALPLTKVTPTQVTAE